MVFHVLYGKMESKCRFIFLLNCTTAVRCYLLCCGFDCLTRQVLIAFQDSQMGCGSSISAASSSREHSHGRETSENHSDQKPVPSEQPARSVQTVSVEPVVQQHSIATLPPPQIMAEPEIVVVQVISTQNQSLVGSPHASRNSPLRQVSEPSLQRDDHGSAEKPFGSASDSEFDPQFDSKSDTVDKSRSDTPLASSFLDAANSPNQNRYRSKSVVRLEKISQSRQKEDSDKPFEDMVLFQSQGDVLAESQSRQVDNLAESRRVDDAEKRSAIGRTRRLSSIYNEFAATVETFLKDHEQSGGDDTSSQQEGKNDDTSLRKIFNLLDQKGEGVVTQASLIEGFRRMGHTKTIETLNTYFQCADENHDGLLQWDEFAKFFRCLTSLDFVSADDADIDVIPPPKPRARNYSTILVTMRTFSCSNLPSQAGRIKCVALSQNRGMYAVAHRNDKNVHLYDYDGNEIRILSGHKDSLLGIAFSNDRKVCATVSRDSMLVLWDCTVGHSVNTTQHPGIVTAVAFSCDGKNIYTGCQDNLVRRFSGSKGHLKAVLDRLPRAELGVTVALACQHHVNKEIVFSRSCDRGAIVADASTLKITTVLEGHKSMVWQAHFRADGTKLLTSCEKYVKVWSAANYTPLFVLDSEQFATEKGIARNGKPKLWTTASFCPPRYGPMIVVFNTDTNMMFVDSETGKLILSHNFRSSVYAAAVSLDSSIIICGDDWGNMYKFVLE